VKDVTEQYEQMRKMHLSERIERLKNDIHRAAHETGSLNEFYERIHQILLDAKMFSAEEFSLGTYDKEDDEIFFEYIKDSVDPKFRVIPHASESGSLSYQIIKDKKSILITRDAIANREKQLGEVPDVFMGVPLMDGEESVGVAMVQIYHGEETYTEEQLYIFKELSSAISEALIEKRDDITRAQNERMLEEINNIANAVDETRDIKELCKKIHEIIKRLIPREELSRNFYLAHLENGLRGTEITKESEVYYRLYRDQEEKILWRDENGVEHDDEIKEAIGDGFTAKLIRE